MKDRKQGPDGRPYVPLSVVSLRKVASWCDVNEDNDLAKAYMAACFAMNGVEEFEEDLWRIKSGVPYEFYFSHVTRGIYMVRDFIGRKILRIIKSEQSSASNSADPL